MLFPREEWRDIKGYEGLYQVSSIGRVRSLNYYGTAGKIKVLKNKKDKDGYLTVNLYKNEKQKNCKVHRLVAEAFVPNQECKLCVDHINTVRDDNYYKNLMWCTRKENSNNKLTKQHLSEALKNKYCGEKSRRSKKVEIFKDGISLGVFFGMSELQRQSEELFGTKLDYRKISAVCSGKRNHHKGYTFRYVE